MEIKPLAAAHGTELCQIRSKTGMDRLKELGRVNYKIQLRQIIGRD